MLLTRKIKIKADRKLSAYLEEASERCRLLYNFSLAEKKAHYEKTGKHLGRYVHVKTLPAVKVQFPEYQRIYGWCLQEVHARLDKAYRAAFARCKRKESKFGFPRFKRKGEFFSQVYPAQAIRQQVNEREFILPTGRTHECNLYVRLHGDIPDGFRQVSIVKEGKHYYACFVYEKKEKKQRAAKKSLYCDLGVKTLVTAVDDKGNVVTVPKFSHHAKHLDELQSKRDRCQKGSRQHRKFTAAFQRQYGKYVRRATDYLHKASRWMVNRKEDRIVVGKLDLKNMLKPRQAWFNRILCNEWRVGKFVAFLQYKAMIEGKTFEERDERNTTRECCKCGATKEMSLADRTYECPQCGLAIGRDVNSAFNMKNRYGKNNRGATAQLGRFATDEELAKASKSIAAANLFARR